MARYFPRSPGAVGAMTEEEAQEGYDMERQMRMLVAEQMAISVTRGSSPRGAYQAAPKGAKKIGLWRMANPADPTPEPPPESLQAAIPLSGGLHSNPCPRGQAPSQSREKNRRSTSTIDSGSRSQFLAMSPPPTPPAKKSTDKKVLENVLGIYPAENKQAPGKSAADEFVASIAKRFQFGRKSSAHSGEQRDMLPKVPVDKAAEGAPLGPSSIDGAALPRSSGTHSTSSRLPNLVASSVVPVPPPAQSEKALSMALSEVAEPPTSRGGDVGARHRDEQPGAGQPRNKSVSKNRKASLPGPSSEGVYINMPLPAIPPTASSLPKCLSIRVPPAAPAETLESPKYGIDIAEWAESVFPKSPRPDGSPRLADCHKAGDTNQTTRASVLNPEGAVRGLGLDAQRQHTRLPSLSRSRSAPSPLSDSTPQYHPQQQQQQPPKQQPQQKKHPRYPYFGRPQSPPQSDSRSSSQSTLHEKTPAILISTPSTRLQFSATSEDAFTYDSHDSALGTIGEDDTPAPTPRQVADSGFFTDLDSHLDLGDDDDDDLPDTLDELAAGSYINCKYNGDEYGSYDYGCGDIYDHYSRESLSLPGIEITTILNSGRYSAEKRLPVGPVVKSTIKKSAIDIEIEEYLAERRRIQQKEAEEQKRREAEEYADRERREARRRWREENSNPKIRTRAGDDPYTAFSTLRSKPSAGTLRLFPPPYGTPF